MLSNEEKILRNSRIAVINTFYIPVMALTLGISAVHFAVDFTILNSVFGWIWMGLTFYTYKKYAKASRQISEMDN